MDYSLGKEMNSAKGGLAYSLAVCAYLAVSLLFSIIISSCGIAETDGGRYLSYLASPLAIVIAVAIFCKFCKQSPRQVFSVKCSPKYYLIALLVFFGLFFSLSSVNGYIVELLKLCGYKPRSATLPSLEGGLVVPAILVIAVLPAVAEEFLFRGVILKNTEKGAGGLRAVLLTGFLFSLYHGSVEQTVYQFVCGCLFALIAVRSGSTLPTVIIHFLNNALIIIFAACGLCDELGSLVMPQAAQITLTVLSAVSLVAGTALLIIDRKKFTPCEKHGVTRFFIYASVGIAVMAIMWIAGLFSV